MKKTSILNKILGVSITALILLVISAVVFADDISDAKKEKIFEDVKFDEQVNNVSGAYTADDEAFIQTMYQYIPDDVVDFFDAHNGKMIFVEDITEYVGDVYASTIYRPSTDEILILVQSGEAYNGLIHEFGHVYLHSINNDDNVNEEFTKLRKTEGKNFITEARGSDAKYFYSNNAEYFSDSFQYVIMNEYAGVLTPNCDTETFEYVQEIIDSLK